MELADKSMSDLLRRLPIIIYEDSSLHPDLPLIMWMMVAHTRDYQMPSSLVSKLFRIVFEIASCPFQDFMEDFPAVSDPLPDDTATTIEISSASPATLALASFQKIGSDVVLPKDDILLWSTLLRAQYGGMGGDLKMLRKFALCWKDRFRRRVLGTEIDSRLPSDVSRPHKEVVQETKTEKALAKPAEIVQSLWIDVPHRIHRAARKQSDCHVSGLLNSGVCKLQFKDLSFEGIDFHCSPILDHLLKDAELVQNCLTRLRTFDKMLFNGKPMPLSNKDGLQRSWLEGVLKSCMWTYSAGVNLRRSLIKGPSQDHGKSKNADHLKLFWNELILPRTKSYAERYIQHRIAN